MDGYTSDNGRMLFDCEMMRLFFIVLSVCILSLRAEAQPADEKEMIRHIEEASAAIESIECSFVQTNVMKILDDEMVSTGKMYCRQPGRLRWEYVSPYSSIFMVNCDKVFLENDGKVDSVDVRKNRIYREMSDFMLGSVSGKYLSDEKAFNVSVTAEDREWAVTLVPIRKSLAQMWEKIVLYFDPEKNALSGIEMYERSGDMTILDFKDIKLNGNIDPGLFQIK